MPLLVGQIIYTSFSKVGFKSLLSAQIPLEIQQAFIEQIVYQHWDTYNPPQSDYRAAYLYQFSREKNLFGWLYNDGTDDLGRANIPYFIGYYFAGLLNTFQLNHILTCLQTGPVTQVDRQKPPTILETIAIPDWCNYQPTRTGVTISSELHQQSHKRLQQKKLLTLFIPVEEIASVTQPNPSFDAYTNEVNAAPFLNGKATVDLSSKALAPVLEQNQVTTQSMNTNKIEGILQELVAKPIGIQGTVLVSAQGQPLTPSVGMDENSALIMAGTMLYLATSTCDEFNWQEIETISVRGREGHVVLASCNRDVFLLVKAGKALTGLLEGEINRTVKKLQAALQVIEETTVQPEILPQLTTEVLPKVDEVLYELNAENSAEPEENEIRYRGRRTNL